MFSIQMLQYFSQIALRVRTLVLFIYNAVIARLNFCVQCYTYPVLYCIVIVDQMDYSTLSGIFMDNSQTMNMTKISKNYLIHGIS